MRKILLLVFFVGSSLGTDVSAANIEPLQAEIFAYNKADFQKVVSIGEKIIVEQPDNDIARYYLANAFSRLDLLPQAIKQYNFCAMMSHDPAIRAYSAQALSVLNGYSGKSQTNNWTNPAHFAGAVSMTTYQMDPSQVDNDFHTIQSQANLLDNNIELGRHGDLVGATYAEDTRIDSVTARLSSRRMIPAYGYGGYRGEVSYGSYNGVPYLTGPAQFRVDAARHYFGQVLPWDINREYSQQEVALNSSVNSLHEQLQGGDSPDGMALSPQGTNLYVRNYVDTNLPPEPPVITGLKAIAASPSR